MLDSATLSAQAAFDVCSINMGPGPEKAHQGSNHRVVSNVTIPAGLRWGDDDGDQMVQQVRRLHSNEHLENDARDNGTTNTQTEIGCEYPFFYQ